MKKQPKIIEYTNILHAYGLGSRQANEFKQVHENDKNFLRRAKSLEEMRVVLPKNYNKVPNMPVIKLLRLISLIFIFMGVGCLVVSLGIIFMLLIL